MIQIEDAEALAERILTAGKMPDKRERDRTLGRLLDETERADRENAGMSHAVCRLVARGQGGAR